jgi:hypothetical protein
MSLFNLLNQNPAMSNSKGNAFPLWYVDNNFEIFAVANDGSSQSKSKSSFASKVAVSEDGTVWALSVTPDPDGGGAKLFWSNGDGNWTEINTPDPGGVGISGYTGSSCIYNDWDGNLRSMNTDGTSSVLFNAGETPLVEAAYGGGMIWCLKPPSAGQIPVLSYSSDNGSSWKEFAGDIYPYGLSVSYNGDCYATDQNFNPMYYSKDGSSSASAGSGIDGKTLSIAFANWCFALGIDANENGNLIYEWQDEAGGTFRATAARGMSIAASYYLNE